MSVEVKAPASLLLGLVRHGPSLLAAGLTVRYPPVHLEARPSARLEVSGACAPIGYAAAERVGLAAEIEVELAIPTLMGLASGPMLALSVARALAELHGRPADAPTLAQALGFSPDLAPEVWGFAQGGLLLTDLGAPLVNPPLRRQAIAHKDDVAWVIVLFLPRPGDDAPENLEADRRAALLAAARHLPAEAARGLLDELWPAVERDDFPAFAQALGALHAANLDALAAAGTPLPLSDQQHAMLDLMRAEGAAMCGPCLTGLGVFGLIQGAPPSIRLRQKMQALVGFAGGTVMGTITDNAGVQVQPL